jgi:hypothetical protein
MSDNHGAVCNRDILLENFAAELTSAAYAVALRHGVEDKWLDLELELWEALQEMVKKREQEPPHFSDVPFVCDWIQVSPKARRVIATESASVVKHVSPFSGE